MRSFFNPEPAPDSYLPPPRGYVYPSPASLGGEIEQGGYPPHQGLYPPPPPPQVPPSSQVYQDYFTDYDYPTLQSQQYSYSTFDEGNSCLSFLQGCMAALCCCCMLEECC